MNLLTESMAFQELNGPVSRHAWPEDGVQITCTKVGGQGYITIYAGKGGGPRKKRQLEKELVKVFVHVDMINTEDWTVMYEVDCSGDLAYASRHFGTELVRSMISSAVSCGVVNIIDGALFWSDVVSPYDEVLEHDLLAEHRESSGWEGMEGAPHGTPELLQDYVDMFPGAPTVFDAEIPSINIKYVDIQFSGTYFFRQGWEYGDFGYQNGIIEKDYYTEDNGRYFLQRPPSGSIWEWPCFVEYYHIIDGTGWDNQLLEGDYSESCYGIFMDNVAATFIKDEGAAPLNITGRASRWSFQLFRGRGIYYDTLQWGQLFGALWDYKTTGYMIEDPIAGVLWDYFYDHAGITENSESVFVLECPYEWPIPEPHIRYVSTEFAEWPACWVVRNMLRYYDGSRDSFFPYTCRGDLPFEDFLNTHGVYGAGPQDQRTFLFEHGKYDSTNYRTSDNFAWYLATGGGIISRYHIEQNYIECHEGGWIGPTGENKHTEIHKFKTLYNISAVAGWDVDPVTVKSMPQLNGAIRQLAEKAVLFLGGNVYDTNDLPFEKEDLFRSFLAGGEYRIPSVYGFKQFPGLLYCSPLFNIRIYCIPVSGKTVEEVPE